MSTSTTNNPPTTTQEQGVSPHIIWTICILILLVIGLISYILFGKVLCAYELMEYISYASVLLSITLSIFAILYTYTSNVQIQQQFEKINSAATKLSSTSDKLDKTGHTLDSNLSSILEQLNVITNSQKEMSTKINNLSGNTNKQLSMKSIPSNAATEGKDDKSESDIGNND